ncbi:hypothetical protein ACFPRL_14475 [Pseudoclavibacter helvolus]
MLLLFASTLWFSIDDRESTTCSEPSGFGVCGSEHDWLSIVFRRS